MEDITKNWWMGSRKIKLVINLVAVGLFLLSIIFSFFLSNHMAMAKEIDRLDLIASNVVQRMKLTRVQFAEVLKSSPHVSTTDPCSPTQILNMQKFVVNGIFLQAVAHIKGTVIECSSLPSVLDGLDLERPTNIEPDGTSVWTGVAIPKWNLTNFVIFEKDGWAILIAPNNAIEALGSEEVAVGIFSIRSSRIFAERGTVAQDWLDRYRNESKETFIDENRKMLVHITPAESNRSAIFTAIPLSEITKSTNDFTKILLPLGAMMGVAVAILFLLVAKHRYSPKNALMKALIHDEFYMEYQPVIELKTQKCVAAEALIRWKPGGGAIISPDQFIPFAEENGIIAHITRRVFELVAKDMQHVLQQNPDFHIGVNISSQDLMSGGLLALIQRMVQDSGGKPQQFIIEATERGFLNNENSLKIMKDIRDSGVKIAIDDFGTGYSSLAYLTKFELDYLKIDKAFVDSIGTESVTKHVVFSIIEMAKRLNLKMVAEGVETELQAKLLAEKGVTHAQGWLFSKSLLPLDFINYLKTTSPKE